MLPWLTRIASLFVWLVLVCTAGPALAGPPSAEQLCLELIDSSSDRARTIEACERAHAEVASARTGAALAVALAESGDFRSDRIYELVVDADSGATTEPEVLGLLLRAVSANGQDILAWEFHDRLAKHETDDWRLHALLLETALDQERNFKAAGHLRRLRELDPPATELEPLEQRYDEQVPAWIHAVSTALAWLPRLALVWLLLTLTIFGLGVAVALQQRRAVAAWTPQSAHEPPAVPLRELQHVLLRASVLAYWSALLLLALMLLLFGLALFALALHLPGFLKGSALIFAGFVVGAIATIFRAGRFGRVTPPGFHHRLEDEPELMQLSQAAASVMAVPPAVALSFTTDARLELLARPRPTLVIGIALLDAIDTEQFKLLLSREYARTRSAGAAGHLVAPILLSIAQELEHQTTPMRLFNPGWYMLLGFHRLYRFMASGAAREQDLLADRWAAAAHGSTRLADAIVHLLDVQVRFDASLVAIEAELPRRTWLLANVYTHEPEPRPSEQALAAELDRRLASGDALTDGMSINARIARLEALVLPPPAASGSAPSLGQKVRARTSLQVTGTNTFRIALERRLNKFIKLEPELEAAVRK